MVDKAYDKIDKASTWISLQLLSTLLRFSIYRYGKEVSELIFGILMKFCYKN